MEYKCDYCNKTYASRQSRWNHVKRLHSYECDQMSSNVSKKSDVCTKNVSKCTTTLSTHSIKLPSNVCKYCNKHFCDRKYRWYHEQKCKQKHNQKY
jgi:hypothetical protein